MDEQAVSATARGRVRRIAVRATSEEAAELSRRAREAGTTVSGYVRRRALCDDGRPVVRADADELRRLHYCLRRAGGNLNQAMRFLNARSASPGDFEEGLVQAARSVGEAAEEVSSFLRDVRESA